MIENRFIVSDNRETDESRAEEAADPFTSPTVIAANSACSNVSTI
jgi:hypothetical protein